MGFFSTISVGIANGISSINTDINYDDRDLSEEVSTKKEKSSKEVIIKNELNENDNYNFGTEDISELLSIKDNLLKEIETIEEQCEGIENKANAQKISILNSQKSEIIAKQNKIKTELRNIENQLNLINNEINKFSSDGIDKILDAIDNQRYYLLKNKPKIIVDIKTGAIITNLDYLKYKNDNGNYIDCDSAIKLINKLELEGYTNWRFIEYDYLGYLMEDSNFYLNKYIGTNDWLCIKNSLVGSIEHRHSFYQNSGGYLIGCSYEICSDSYETDVKEDNNVYAKSEKLQMSLDLLVNNGLEPIFDDEEITELYRKIFIEKPVLLNKLSQLQSKIEEVQEQVLLSSTFDYNTIFMNYDIKSIDSSIIKYYEAVQSWIDDLLDKLQYFEEVKWDIIREFNVCGLKLSKKYEDIQQLDEKENLLLKNRQAFLKKNIDLGMSNVKTKLLSVKKQADILEERIEEINDNEDSIKLLAELEEEKRASFKFIAENTANIIKNALLKVEYFEDNKDFVTNIINSEAKWSDNYKVFKTKDKEELKSLSEEDGIEDEVYLSWYEDWTNKKYILEESFTELIKKGIKKTLVSTINDEKESKYVINDVINILDEYTKDLDYFYKNERKNIYQKYAFAPGGDIQEKLEVESDLYKITVKFQTKLQDIIFKLDNVEDRIFLLTWAENIIDLQVNEVLYFVKDKDFNKISESILNQFADLKRSNLENYITDAQLYSEEKANREKQFNSLMFKMRKELMS